MNYQSIYSRFIADRRTKEAALIASGAYSERHHILPRAHAGDDTPTNLIRLTPEDHFFAHLLLAKIHGGEMWAPIAFMVGGSRKDYKPTQSRKRHGWATRALSKAKSGEGAYQFDHTEYSVVNEYGHVMTVKQSEMPSMLGISKPLANMLIKGRVSVARGWSIVGQDRKTIVGDKHPMHRPEVREFKHVNGDSFVGTQLEFSDQKNMRRPDVSRLVTGVYRTSKGWYLAERGITDSAQSKAKWQKHLSN